MNSRIALALGYCVLFASGACRERQPSAPAAAVGTFLEDSPEAVAKRYLDAYYHGPARVEYECLTSEFRAKVNREVFEEQRKDTYQFSPYMSFEIKEVQRTGDTATAVVAVTHPDFWAPDLDTIVKQFQQDPTAGRQLARDALQKAPKVTDIQRLELRHESDGWKVWRKPPW